MNLTVGLQKFATCLARILPIKLGDLIAITIGKICFLILKKRRGYILKNLLYIFPERSNKEIYDHAEQTFKNFSLCMADFLRIWFLKPEELKKSVEVRGLKNLREALKYKRGCALITLHIGNWDYAGVYLAAMGFPMIAIVEETEPEVFKLYTRNRERTGLVTYPLSKSSFAFIDMIKNNKILAIVADRDITGQGVIVRFLKGKRKIPKNLGEIIIKRQIPVVFAFLVLYPRFRRRRYLGIVEEPIFFDDKDKFNLHLVRFFEETIRKYPDQWFVFHPEWIE